MKQIILTPGKKWFTVWNVAGGQPVGFNGVIIIGTDKQAIKWAKNHNNDIYKKEQAHRRIYPMDFIHEIGEINGTKIMIPFNRNYSTKGFKL